MPGFPRLPPPLSSSLFWVVSSGLRLSLRWSLYAFYAVPLCIPVGFTSIFYGAHHFA